MPKAEAQYQQTQRQPAERRANKGMAVESPQSERIAQFELMAENSPQAREQMQLTATIEASPRMAAQRRIADVIHNSPRQVAQRKVAESLNNSPHVPVQRQTQNGAFADETTQEDTGEPLQAEVTQREERPEKPNNTGLPDTLKSGIESLSGMSMDNVKVHYNSSRPAQLNAYAYAQGTDIHVAPGREKHLPHEAWHVVQQAKGRVKPTMQMKGGVPVNDDKSLEHEADVMGEMAFGISDVGIKKNFAAQQPIFYAPNFPIQCFFELPLGTEVGEIRTIVNKDKKPQNSQQQTQANILITRWENDNIPHVFDNADVAADFILRFAGVYVATKDLTDDLLSFSNEILELHAWMESQSAQTALSAQLLQQMMKQYLIARKLLDGWQWDLEYARKVLDFVNGAIDAAEAWLSGDSWGVPEELPLIALPRVRMIPWNGEPVQHLFGVQAGLNSPNIELRKRQIGLLRGADDENNPTIRDEGEGRGHLKGAIPFPFIAACRKGLMGLVRQVGDSVAVFSLERGGALLGDHIVDLLQQMEARRLSHIKVAKTESRSDDEQHGLLVAKMMDVEEGHIFKYMKNHPIVYTRPPPIVMSITETAVSGSSADQVLKTLHRCSHLIPHSRVRVLIEKQTIKDPRLMGQHLGGVRVRDPGIHVPENLDTEDLARVELFVSQVPYILGEDVAYQCTYQGIVRGQPIMIFNERNGVLVAVQLAKAGVLPRDMLRLLVLGAFDTLLDHLMH